MSNGLRNESKSADFLLYRTEYGQARLEVRLQEKDNLMLDEWFRKNRISARC